MILNPVLLAKITANPDAIIERAKQKILDDLANRPTQVYLQKMEAAGYKYDDAIALWRMVLGQANLMHVEFATLLGDLMSE